MGITQDNFRFIQAFVRDAASIVLEAGKEYLVEMRLGPLAQQAGFATLDDFLSALRLNPRETRFHERIIDALTTHETSFFRDFDPFDSLKDHIIPQLIQRRAAERRLNFWSAASSTGQEAYTLAMLIREHFPQLRDWSVSVLGTDLSPAVLNQARDGVYTQLEVSRGLPPALLQKYFTRSGDKWAVKDEVRQMVQFRQMNLCKSWPILPVFDVILIRNVMIYFDVETKRGILKKIRDCLHPHGTLVLGSAETTLNLDPAWHPVMFGKSTVYQCQTSLTTAAA